MLRSNKSVPVLACGHAINPPPASRVDGADSAQRYMHHQPIKSGVRHDQVAAPAQHEQARSSFPRPGRGLDNRIFAGRLKEPARRTADSQRRERRKGFVFFEKIVEVHLPKAISPHLP